MITGQIQHQLAQLNTALAKYGRARGWEPQAVLSKQGTKLAFELAARMRDLPPGSGVIRRERILALAAGEGVHVRQHIYNRLGMAQEIGGRRRKIFGKTGKTMRTRKDRITGLKTRLNVQAAAVDRELMLRESGRMYVARAVQMRMPYVPSDAKAGTLGKATRRFSQYGRLIGAAGFETQTAGDSLRLTWGQAGMDVGIAAGLRLPKAQAAIGAALEAVRADIQVYLARKAVDGLAKFIKRTVH